MRIQTTDPAVMVIVEVLDPDARPPSLHLMSVEVKSIIGLILFVFDLTYS